MIGPSGDPNGLPRGLLAAGGGLVPRRLLKTCKKSNLGVSPRNGPPMPKPNEIMGMRKREYLVGVEYSFFYLASQGLIYRTLGTAE